MASIKISSNFDEQVKLFKLILEKHQADGDNSILKDYALETLAMSADIAATSDKKSKELARLSQEQTQERDRSFAPVEKVIKSVARLLKAKYEDNPKELGKWGYTVVGD